MNVKAIAELLGVHRESVRRWIHKGELKGVKLSNRNGYFVEKKDLDNFIKRHGRADWYHLIDEKRVDQIGDIDTSIEFHKNEIRRAKVIFERLETIHRDEIQRLELLKKTIV